MSKRSRFITLHLYGEGERVFGARHIIVFYQDIHDGRSTGSRIQMADGARYSVTESCCEILEMLRKKW